MTIIQSDAIRFLKSFGDASVPMVFTDPPFGIGYHSNHYKDRNPHAPVSNDWNFEAGALFHELSRVLVDGGAAYVCCRFDVSPLWIPAIAGTGLKLKTVIVWLKDNWSAGDLEGCFGNQYEQILFLTKGRHILRGHRWPNVWPFPRVPHKRALHPTQKPVPLIVRAIEASTDIGAMVVDPFVGSGSTCEAAVTCGRTYSACDIDPKMVRTSKRRLGLHVDDDVQDVADPIPFTADFPDLDWCGIHPEDVREMMAQLQGNCLKPEQEPTQRSVWDLLPAMGGEA